MIANISIKNYIEKRLKELDKKKIATMEEVQSFWAQILRNKGEETKDRLKASEYIAKTHAAFIDRIENNTEINKLDELINAINNKANV